MFFDIPSQMLKCSHASNALLALLTGLTLNFLLMAYASRKKKPTREELSLAGGWHAAVLHAKKTLEEDRF